jgi:hypothetical protein
VNGHRQTGYLRNVPKADLEQKMFYIQSPTESRHPSVLGNLMMQGLPLIVAATLGIGPDDVIVRAADTDAAGYDVGVGGGRTTVALGAASLAAAHSSPAGPLNYD